MKFAALALATPAFAIRGEVWEQHEVEAAGYDDDLPAEFTWGNVNGTSYLTMSRNQHIPQYCGSCWAHGSVSALADRVKIARKAQGADINPSVQHILNCHGGGSCHGGAVDGPYQWLHKLSKKGEGISYETSNPYMACSSESEDGICPHGEWTCTDINIARTCSTFPSSGGTCSEIAQYPQILIDDYGSISGQAAMQKEICAAPSPAASTRDRRVLRDEEQLQSEKCTTGAAPCRWPSGPFSSAPAKRAVAHPTMSSPAPFPHALMNEPLALDVQSVEEWGNGRVVPLVLARCYEAAPDVAAVAPSTPSVGVVLEYCGGMALSVFARCGKAAHARATRQAAASLARLTTLRLGHPAVADWRTDVRLLSVFTEPPNLLALFVTENPIGAHAIPRRGLLRTLCRNRTDYARPDHRAFALKCAFAATRRSSRPVCCA
ncbi:transferase [Aureococcus anophagefferens]|nr:transferase [Aureococcus anophagefferens]